MGQPAWLCHDYAPNQCLLCCFPFDPSAALGGPVVPLQDATPGTPAKMLGALSVCSTPALTRSVLQTGWCAGREGRQVSWEQRLPVCRRSPLLQQALWPSQKAGWHRSFTVCLLALSPARASLLLLLLEALRLLARHKVLSYAPSACCQLGRQFPRPVWCPWLHAGLHQPDQLWASRES